MKRTLLILIALLAMATTGMAQQTVNGLFNRYEDKAGAEYKNLGSLLMGIIKTFAADKSEEGQVIKSIKSIKVLDLEECTPEVKQEFAQKARNLKPRGMELLMQMKDDGENVCIWGKMKKETVRQLLIVTDDKMVKIKGKFDLNGISNLINSKEKK